LAVTDSTEDIYIFAHNTSVFNTLDVYFENALCKFTFDIDIFID